MKTLKDVTPSPEQLPLIVNSSPGITLIRGAAGSGKTTTALLRLRQLSGFYRSRRTRQALTDPVRVLVMTFNRTLKGYVAALAAHQIQGGDDLELSVTTFGRWSKDILMPVGLLEDGLKRETLQTLAKSLPVDPNFIVDEVEYATGRFLPSQLNDYIQCKREGRGAAPRFDRALRERLIREVIQPYVTWKRQTGKVDWNDLAVELAGARKLPFYDVVIMDEAQDLSANQVRAVMNHASAVSSVTFVLDATQRIYPRGFTWKEADVNINQSYRLMGNQRNTKQIAIFARSLVAGIDVGDDGTLPDWNSCKRDGPLPVLVKGNYLAQVDYAIQCVRELDLDKDSVAFLKPKGGRWFEAIESRLRREGFGFVDMTRQGEWPKGTENIALSTMSSAKGLEFDHVFILGLNQQVTPHGNDPDDSDALSLRRLLAMAITRSRSSVLIGCKPSEASELIKFFATGTFQEVVL